MNTPPSGPGAAGAPGSGAPDDPFEQEYPRRMFLRVGIVAAGGAMAAAYAGRGVFASLFGSKAANASGWRPGQAPNPIPAENARPGDPGWNIPGDPERTTLDAGVKGFASAVSLKAGESFDLYVSTDAASYDVEIYRLGWYGGAGARLVHADRGLTGKEQAPATVSEPIEYTVEAPWEPTHTVQTTDAFTSGVFLIKLVASDGSANFVPLVVRDDRPSALLMQASCTTWLAYNTWGGKSFYKDTDDGTAGRSRVSSFHRPTNGNGAWKFLRFEVPLIRYMEREGFDVSYATNLETHTSPELLMQHGGVISPGHDEYWTGPMRDNLEAARDAGVNLAFLGANGGYRKIRFEDSPHGKHTRVAHYKEHTEDPLLGVDDGRVAAQWRWGPANRPENALIGIMYVADPVNAPWIAGDTSHWLYDGSGLRPGDSIPHIVGHEYDRAFTTGPYARFTPEGLTILARSPIEVRGERDESHTSLYYAPSGAGVFAAGTNRWAFALDDFDNGEPGHGTNDARMQRFTANLLDAMSAGPMTDDHTAAASVADARAARSEAA